MKNENAGPVKRLLGVVCHYCPLCRYGRKEPDSVVGRLLRHPFHSENCPFWKAEKELYKDS